MAQANRLKRKCIVTDILVPVFKSLTCNSLYNINVLVYACIIIHQSQTTKAGSTYSTPCKEAI